MSATTWGILGLGLLILVLAWVALNVHRLDRLDDRVSSTRSALDAQLVRRSAAALEVTENGFGSGSRGRGLHRVARVALNAGTEEREAAENELGRVLRDAGTELAVAAAAPARAELLATCEKVVLARRFYNDAVRDLRQLRGQRMPRLFRLGADRELPFYFDIDDRPPQLSPASAGLPDESDRAS